MTNPTTGTQVTTPSERAAVTPEFQEYSDWVKRQPNEPTPFEIWQAARATTVVANHTREPLTPQAATCAAARCKSQNVVAAFVEGVRFAERAHGIGVTK